MCPWYMVRKWLGLVTRSDLSTACFYLPRVPEYIILPKGCFGIYVAAAAKSLQSCLTLCDPIDGSPPGSPVPGILQARTLEWVVISFSFGIYRWA